MMKLNEHGRNLIKDAEALVLHAYDDRDPSWPRKKVTPGMKVRGVLTIGWGHTGADVKPGLTWTKEQAEKALDADLEEFVKEMNKNLRLHDLLADNDILVSSNQFAALTSLVYNIGDPAFDASTLYRFMKAKDYNSAAGQFPRWCYDGDKKLDGLVKRRLKEQRLFLTSDGKEPDYSNID